MKTNVSLVLTNTVAYSYDLYFDLSDGYTIDAYEGIDTPVEIYAYVMNSQGVMGVYPELISIVYTADTGASNETGIFTKEDLAISPGEEVGVSVVATFSDGSTLKGTTVVYADYIQPTFMPTRIDNTTLGQTGLEQDPVMQDQRSTEDDLQYGGDENSNSIETDSMSEGNLLEEIPEKYEDGIR